MVVKKQPKKNKAEKQQENLKKEPLKEEKNDKTTEEVKAK